MAQNKGASDAPPIDGSPIEDGLQQYRKALARTRWPFRSATRNKGNDQVSNALKSLALQVSRASVQRVADRRSRAETKATLYNHLLPLLASLHAAESRLHVRQTRFFVGLSGTFAVALIAGVVFLV
jgi:hypothetical protein